MVAHASDSGHAKRTVPHGTVGRNIALMKLSGGWRGRPAKEEDRAPSGMKRSGSDSTLPAERKRRNSTALQVNGV